MNTQEAPTRTLVPVPEARGRLGGIGNTTFYALVKSGAIKTTHIGRRTFVTSDEIERYIAGREADNDDHA